MDQGRVDDGSPRVFVDVTTSLMLAGEPPIGISRVEGELARRLLCTSKFKAIPVVFRSDGLLLALSPAQAERIFAAKPSQEDAQKANPTQKDFPSTGDTAKRSVTEISEILEEPVQNLKLPLSVRVRLSATGSLRYVARAAVASLPFPVREDVRAILTHIRKIARTMIFRSDSTLPPPPLPPLHDQIIPELRAVVHPCKGDVFWTAGLYSNFVPLRRLGEIREKTGLKVATTFYDLIRVFYPQFNPASMGANVFAADAIAMLDSSDLVLAISNWSRNQLLEYAKQVDRHPPETVALRLGCDLTTRERTAHPTLLSNVLRSGFALSVGTIEPRKNYALLLSIWEKLCDDPTFQLDLLIVGRPGFECETSVAQITNSPLFQRRIHWWSHCTDEILCLLYESCHVFVYPSLVEGWGLPVTEALSLGCPVIASDRGAIPEASYGLAQLLDPRDEDSWTEAIGAAAKKPREKTMLQNPPTWDAAASAVVTHLAQLLKPSEVV